MENSSFFLLKISHSHLKPPTPGLENSSFNPPRKLTVSIVPLVEFPEKDLASSSRVSPPSHSPLPTPHSPMTHIPTPQPATLDPPLPITNTPANANNPHIPNLNVLSPASLTTLLALINHFPQISKPDQRRFSSWGGNGGGDGCCTYLVDEWMEGLEVVYGWGFSCWMEGGGYGMGFHDGQESLITPFSLLKYPLIP